MYENIVNKTEKNEFNEWTALRVELRAYKSNNTIQTTVLNNPAKLFEFFENEQIKLTEKQFYDLKIRKTKKFIEFLKEVDIDDCRDFLKIVELLGIKKIDFAYVYDRQRYG